MKNKICALWAFVVALFSAPPMREFRIGYIGLLQAKSGTITAGGGTNAELEAAVAQSDPKVATLAQTAVDALAESALPKVVTICTGNRKVRVLPAGSGVDAALAGSDVNLNATVVKDDPTKSSSPMTVSDSGGILGADIEAITGLQKPALSVAALAAKIEDALVDHPGEDAIIVIDQPNGRLRVFAGTTGQSIAADGIIAAAFAEEAVFTQTITVGAAAERPFGE